MMRRRKTGGSAPPLTGSVSVPGDKSISHRALILSALAEGSSTVTGLNPGEDVRATADAVAALGAGVGFEDEDNVKVEGYGYEGLHEPDDVVDLGNSGTSMRTLLGVCAGVE